MTLGISRVNWELPHVFEKAGPFTYNGRAHSPDAQSLGISIGPKGSTNYISPRIMLILDLCSYE
jgi:hypothetical protein